MSNSLSGIEITQEDLNPYFDAVEQLRVYIKQFATKELVLPPERITSRVKTIDDIYEKIERKNYHVETKEDIFKCLDDIAGTRIVCDYLSEVEQIRDYINGCDKFQNPRFEDYISKPNCTGYRSCHCITDIETISYGQVKCEIQIRTTAQHSWAEKSHPLVYKKNKEDIPKIACEMLINLSDQLFLCDQMSESIKNFIEENAKKRN